MSILLCIVDLDVGKENKPKNKEKNLFQNKLHTSGYTDVLINLHKNKIIWWRKSFFESIFKGKNQHLIIQSYYIIAQCINCGVHYLVNFA